MYFFYPVVCTIEVNAGFVPFLFPPTYILDRNCESFPRFPRSEIRPEFDNTHNNVYIGHVCNLKRLTPESILITYIDQALEHILLEDTQSTPDADQNRQAVIY